MLKETRLADVTLHEEDEKMILEGYAIVFNNETIIGDKEYGFIETIDPNALQEAKMKDVPMKYNHMDSFLILARTRNRSLILTVDSKGLKVRAELLDTHTNQDIYKMVRSGLLDKMSFAFTVDEQVWNREGDIPKRIITKINRLYDVSVVDTPAYDSTSIYARSLESMELELKAMDMVEQEEQSKIIRKRIKIKTQT
jgi:HK97 family phage prohead protease